MPKPEPKIAVLKTQLENLHTLVSVSSFISLVHYLLPKDNLLRTYLNISDWLSRRCFPSAPVGYPSNLIDMSKHSVRQTEHCFKQVLAIRRVFSLVDMTTNTEFSNCPNVFKIGVVQQFYP